MMVWTVLTFLMVGNHNIELYGILLLIGLLVCRELSSSYVEPIVAERMDIMIYVGVIFFVVVVTHRVLTILGIV